MALRAIGPGLRDLAFRGNQSTFTKTSEESVRLGQRCSLYW